MLASAEFREGKPQQYPDRTHLVLRHSKDFVSGMPRTMSDVWLSCLQFLSSDEDKEVNCVSLVLFQLFTSDCIPHGTWAIWC